MIDWIIGFLAFFATTLLPGIAAKRLEEMQRRNRMRQYEHEWNKMKGEKKNDK